LPSHHHQSRNRLIFHPVLPTPWASYQCTSAYRTDQLARRTLAFPFSFRQRRPPCRLRSALSVRMRRPIAIVSTSVISPTISKCIQPYVLCALMRAASSTVPEHSHGSSIGLNRRPYGLRWQGHSPNHFSAIPRANLWPHTGHFDCQDSLRLAADYCAAVGERGAIRAPFGWTTGSRRNPGRERPPRGPQAGSFTSWVPFPR